MTRIKLVAAAAVLSTLVSAPAMAAHHHHRYQRDQVYQDRGSIGGPIGAAADVAGAAIGTAGAIATAPFRSSYNYNYDRDMGPSGYACRPGTWFKGEDGRRHICQ